MPASGEFIDALADYLVGSGLATGRYATSGTSVQINYRRDFGTGLTYVLLTQNGGPTFPFDLREHQTVQVLVDAPTLSGAQAKAREIFDFLHETVATEISGGHRVMWLRALATPQAIPIGPGAGEAARFQFSTNFDAFLVKD